MLRLTLAQDRHRASMEAAYGFCLFPVPTWRPAVGDRWRVTPHLPSLAPGYISRAAFEFRYVLTCGKTAWMSTGRMERESHAWHVHQAQGIVVAAGLGLGLYAYAAAMKQSVELVVVAEVSPDVIRVMQEATGFEEWPCRAKVRIIETDVLAADFAARVLEATSGRRPDYFYADIWPSFPAPDAPTTTAKIAQTLNARAAGWWGQEVAFGQWCRQTSHWPDEDALKNYFAEVGVPVSVTAGYAAFCRDAMKANGISLSRHFRRTAS